MILKETFILILSIFLYFICLLGNSKAEDTAFPPKDISELVGHSTCELPHESKIGLFGLPLKDIHGHVLEFRKKGSFKIVLLLTEVKNLGDCGKIVGVLKLPKYNKGESLEYDCHFKDDKQEHADIIIGLADNKGGKLHYAVARLAWSVNLEKNIFKPITNKIIICDTSGYAGAE